MKWYQNLFYNFTSSFLKTLMNLLVWFSQVKHISGNEQLEEIIEEGEPTIFCFWHKNIFYCASFFSKKVIQRGIHLSAMISHSKDAEILARVMKKLKSSVIRGSSSRDGTQALVALYRHLKKRYHSIIITPDGPRGPKYSFQDGAVFLARLSQAPIVPIHFEFDKKWILNSWDNFTIPKPFSKVVIQIGAPYRVPKEISEDKIEEMRQEIEQIMLKQVDNAKVLLKRYTSNNRSCDI